MEDFAPIIWVLVIIGFAAYGSISQARKKATEGPVKQRHDEAWPSWDMKSAPQPDPQAEEWEQQEPEKPLWPPRQEFAEKRRAHQQDENAQIDTKTREFEHEIPAEHLHDVYQSQTLKTTDFTHADTSAAKSQSPHQRIAAPGQTTNTIGEQNTENRPTEDGEEFDLRKAVIYSEILKPKFKE